ncbi:uncharacterized protein [Henckelia pumila]|uniref:uncharacterized protein n=1 Tax=Henckelia pumila TaxID=405737 RepID=UPI003C6DD1F9
MELSEIQFNIIRFPHPRRSCSGEGDERSAQPILCRWRHPAVGLVAVNCDASYRASNDTGGYGIIIRDHMGRVKMTKASRFRMSCAIDKQKASRMEYGVKVLMLEMIAIRDGLRLSKSLGFMAVEVRSDSKTAIAILIGQAPCPDDCREIVSEIMLELRLFPVLGFIFVYGECNRAADFLSKFVTGYGEKCMDWSELPQDLHQIVLEDALGLLIERLPK